jgi:hypothetical protein
MNRLRDIACGHSPLGHHISHVRGRDHGHGSDPDHGLCGGHFPDHDHDHVGLALSSPL